MMTSLFLSCVALLLLLLTRLMTPAANLTTLQGSEPEVLVCPPGGVGVAPDIRVYLTVSSLASTSPSGEITERQLELNWVVEEIQDGDWVGLFDHDPVESIEAPLANVSVADYPSGYFRSQVGFGRPDLRHIGTMQRQCLGFWIAYVRNDAGGATVVAATDCLKIQPRWMQDASDVIGPLTIRQLFLPGTHDSGSYARYKGRKSEDLLTRWVITQDEDLWEQLVYGIRVFDFRLGYYGGSEVFWLNHNFVRVNPLRNALEDLGNFLNQTSHEVVVLDFHLFPVGFSNRPQRHAELVEFVVNHLGHYAVVRESDGGATYTLNALWRSGKRVIISYSDETSRVNSAILWPSITQFWANTNQPGKLFAYLDQTMEDQGDPATQPGLWAAMAELTPAAFDIFMGNGSLRFYADEVNRNVTRWFRDLWWYQANLVDVDFFLGTNVVDVSIEANTKRSRCRAATSGGRGSWLGLAGTQSQS